MLNQTDSAPRVAQQVTFLAARDLEANTAFYQDILGLNLALDQGVCRIYAVAGAAFLGFCRHLAPPDRSPGGGTGPIITLVSADVDGWYRYLLQRGVTVEKPPTLNPAYNIYHLFLRDPDGYLVEIQRFLDPAWPDP